jgi:predicted dehydrogenase
MTNVAVVGVGGWGRNLARNYFEIPECNLRYICDQDSSRLEQMRRQLPGTKGSTDFGELLGDSDLQAVVVATPAFTHYRMCREALLAGKDVYVEKPFVLRASEAEELIKIAEDRKRVLMVGHLLEYHPVVNRLRDMIRQGELGQVYYIYSQRVNLGTVRGDENAMWSLAPHDISVALYLLDQEPTDVIARGQSYLQPGVEDVAFLTLDFGGSSMAHIHVSWLDPHKVRKLTVVGSKKMAVFDDLEATEKLRVYDKGAQCKGQYDSFAEYVTLRVGDIHIPHVKMAEPLRLECQHFLECVANRKTPLSDGHDGLRVVKVLEAAQRSLQVRGEPGSIAMGADAR